MFTHVMIGANDSEAMVAFYDEVLVHFDLLRITTLDNIGPASVIWRAHGRRWPQFVIGRPIDGLSATAGNGVQVSFRCRSRTAVNKAWNAALRDGSDEGEPGDRPLYSNDFYAASVRDPEGNKLCFLFCQDFVKGGRG